MKRFCLLVIFLQCTILSGHGFGAYTLVQLADNSWQQISTICYRAQKKKISIASYDTTSSFQTTAQVIRGGRSTTNCYIRFGFEEHFKNSQHYDEVACTPTQEFYVASTHQWVPAYVLKIGDELLCAQGITKAIAYVELVKKQIDIYTIEVKRTHTFFVTNHSLLTHNMVLPIAFNLGLSIPFGASAGGAAGSFFGPPTFLIGAAIGCVIGALVKIACDSKVPTYTVETYDSRKFEQHVEEQPVLPMLCDQNLPQVTIGCGDITPQKPLVLVTPAEPTPVFQNPDYTIFPPEKPHICIPPLHIGMIPDVAGCGGNIPEELSGKGSNILFTEGKTAEETAAIIYTEP